MRSQSMGPDQVPSVRMKIGGNAATDRISVIISSAPRFAQVLLLKQKFDLLDQGFPTFLLPCTPSAFRQRRMYPFNILKDKHVPL